MTNIKSLAIAATVDYLVTDAAGVVQEGMSITLDTPGTKRFQQARHNFEKKKSSNVVALMTGKSDNARTWENDNADLAEFLADVTVSLNGFDYEGLPPGKETYKAMYADITIGHIAEGINKLLGDRGNVKRALPTS